MFDRSPSSFEKIYTLIFHSCRHVIGGHAAHKKLTVTGCRNGTRRVVRICARTDQRCVAHAAKFLIAHSAGGCRGGQSAVRVTSDGPDGTDRLLSSDTRFLTLAGITFSP